MNKEKEYMDIIEFRLNCYANLVVGLIIRKYYASCKIWDSKPSFAVNVSI